MGIFTREKIVEVEKVIEKVVNVDRVIIGAPAQIDLYRAYDPGYYSGIPGARHSDRTRTEYGYFTSCAEAFVASDNEYMKVEKVKALVIDGEYMTYTGSLTPVKVTKPKKAKGRQ